MRLIVLLLGSALFALPSSADACSCRGWSDLPTALRTARDEAGVIVHGRVVSVVSLQARIEVIEAFKGATGGAKLVLNTDHDGADCRSSLESGEEYLVYAYLHEGRLSTSMCTRTRKVSKGDAELDWLRTGRLPPVPVALRREQAQCTPCSLETVATGLTGQRGLSPGAEEVTQALALKKGRPFWDGGYSSRDDRGRTTVGLSLDLRLFELVQTPYRATDETCQQRVTQKWCERLETAPPPDSQGPPRLRCVNPGPERVVCDERKSRQVRRSPKEPMTAARCQHWFTADRAMCMLDKELQPLAPETATPWVLACKPQDGFERLHMCQVVPGDAIP